MGLNPNPYPPADDSLLSLLSYECIRRIGTIRIPKRRERPRGRCTAEQRDELATSHALPQAEGHTRQVQVFITGQRRCALQQIWPALSALANRRHMQRSKLASLRPLRNPATRRASGNPGYVIHVRSL